jgi:hypothetical protein
MAQIRLFWNVRGDYIRFEIPEVAPLTKYKHEPFTRQDYLQLVEILKDSLSILGNLQEKDLTEAVTLSKSKDNIVDGYTGATTKNIQDYIIKGAVYTCYTLWHTVYGATRERIKEIEKNKTDTAYISKLFAKRENIFKVHAIDLVINNPGYFSFFKNRIIENLKSNDDRVSSLALSVFSLERLDEKDIQKLLIQSFDGIKYDRKFELLWKLSAVNQVDDFVILTLLQYFIDKKMDATLLGYTFQLINVQHLKNEEILNKIKLIAENENRFVRNISQKLLAKYGK